MMPQHASLTSLCRAYFPSHIFISFTNPRPRKNIGKVLSVCCAVAISLFARVAHADDWPVYEHDNAHTDDSSASFNPLTLTKSWTAPLGFDLPLIIGPNVISMHNGAGTGTPTIISSFQLGNGTVNWSYSDNLVFPSQIAYGNGMVAFTGQSAATQKVSLYVLNASTGTLQYSVPASSSETLTIAPDPTSGLPVAYVNNNGNGVSAFALGQSSATLLWTITAVSGAFSIPTIVGNSLIVAGPQQYEAIDRTSGVVNHFYKGPGSGGGGDTVAFDQARNQFYVLDDYSGTFNGITAYKYAGNNSITQLWQKNGPGVVVGGEVAIGPTGDIYSVDNSTLVELDPATGNVLRSISGQDFSNAVAPAIVNGYLFAYGNGFTYVYSLDALTLVKTITGSRGSLNSPFDAPGAFDDTHFLLDYGNTFDRPGFDVYVATPEPASLSIVTATALLLLRRRKPNK